MTKEAARAAFLDARILGRIHGQQDPEGTKGPSRVRAHECLAQYYGGKGYDDGPLFDAYASAYREASVEAGGA